MPKQIVPTEFKTHLIDQLIESITEPANTAYYSFIGDHTAGSVPQPQDSIADLNVNTYRKMIMGKKITGDDMKFLVRKNEWVSGTVYSMYDDRDSDLESKQYFISVDEGSYIHVYKCFYNNNDAVSVDAPNFATDIANNSGEYVTTSDGYQWKYMYSVDNVTYNRFFSDSYIPVVSNTVVEGFATNGTLDVFLVEDGGSNWQNYCAGYFNISDITSATTFILSNTNISQTLGVVENFYGNTIIVIKTGAAAGEYREVLSSTQTAAGVQITIDTGFTASVEGAYFELSPKVVIESDGTQTVNCVARALINANASNSVYQIEVLDPGSDYNFAEASIASLVAANSSGGSVGAVSATSASIRPILPPPGGHGANAAIELGATTVGIYQKFDKDEGGTTIPENQFSQYGIIRNPSFSNVSISIGDGIAGSGFSAGETVYQIKHVPLSGVLTVSTSSPTIISASNSNYTSFFDAGDFIYIVDGDNANSQFFTTITSVPNNDHIQLSTNASFSSANGVAHAVKIITQGTVKQTAQGSTLVFLKDVINRIVKNELVIGGTTYTSGIVTGINTNNRYGVSYANSTYDFDFSTFNQALRIEGSIPNFIQDEVVSQTVSGSAVFAGKVHTANATHLFLTEVEGRCNTSLTLTGLTSSETLSPGFVVYSGDIDPTSGTVIYLQNDTAVTRSNTTFEEILVLLEF